MNGSHFHVYAKAHDSASVLEIMKKRPKSVKQSYWWDSRPDYVHWVLKQSELARFVERLQRCDIEELTVTKVPLVF
jgi:hypothetical protein